MADAHYLSDKDGKKFYPYAHASATYDNNGNTVEKRLKALDETASSAVQSVKIGTTEYKSGTTVTLPSYPTSLPASDVPSWAKQKTKPTYTASEVGLGNVGNFKAVSTVESQGLTDTEKSNARANIGAQVAGSYASSTHNHDDKYQAKGSYASASHAHDDRYYTETEIITKLNGKANSSHTHGNGDITSLDASKITSGTISIDRLPQGALERLTVVADDTARFKLTSTSVQKGDTVKVTSTGKMYYVVDESNLSTEDGYEVYAAGTAASVPWSGVTGKPSTYTPSSHTHDDRYYTENEIDSKLGGKANSSHTHTKSQITDFPTSMPANGGNATTVNGHTVNSDVPSGAKFTDTNTWRPQPDWNATSGDAVIKNKPAIPSVGNGTVTITQNGTSKGTFTMNQSGNTTIALTDTNTDTNTVTNIGTTSSNYSNGNILIKGSGATTVSKSGNTVTISSTNTDTNTWRPLGTTADTACAGNDSRLSNARPANGGTSTYANYVYATSHQGSWYQNSQWDGTYFQTNYKNGDNVLPMKVNNAGYADSAGSVAWSNVSGRPSSMPASDVYSWAKASTKPGYSWSEIGSKPSTFTPSSHTHNYAGSSSAGGSANSLYYFQNTSSTNVGQAEGGSNAIAYISDYSGTALTSGVKDGALYRQAYSTSWVHQIYGDYRTGQIAVRGKNNGTWQNWRRVLDESNYKTFCTPANIGAAAANHSHSNYLTGINKSMVVNALGYTPPTSDTNTWRGVQNNLTSTATDQSLSAYQGKVLRDMIHRVIVQSSEPTISTNDEWLQEYT